MKNILFDQKKIKLQNTCHLVGGGGNRDYAVCLQNAANFLAA
jgi:hypothetical protein